jgi:hypothetical protein
MRQHRHRVGGHIGQRISGLTDRIGRRAASVAVVEANGLVSARNEAVHQFVIPATSKHRRR